MPGNDCVDQSYQSKSQQGDARIEALRQFVDEVGYRNMLSSRNRHRAANRCCEDKGNNYALVCADNRRVKHIAQHDENDDEHEKSKKNSDKYPFKDSCQPLFKRNNDVHTTYSLHASCNSLRFPHFVPGEDTLVYETLVN